MKVIKNHVPPTPKPTSALSPTPPSKTISDTKTNQQAEQFSSKFILVVVEDMWVFCLRDPDTFYSDVTPHQLLAHLTTSGGGTETNNKTVMYTLVTNKKMLTATNAKLIATTATFAASGISAKPPESSGARNPNHTLQEKIRKKWAIGGLCSTHVWEILSIHDSKTCLFANRKPGHDEAAMCENPKGSSAKSNKGWDAWVFCH